MSENHAKTVRRSAAPRRGSALIIVILVALVLTVIGLGIAFFATTEDKTSGNVRMSKVGFYAAEAGLREAEAAITTYASSRPAGDCTPLLTGTPYNPPGGGRPAYPLVIDGRRFANIVLPVELGDPSTRAMYSVFVRNNEEDLTGGNNADSDKRINIVVVGQMVLVDPGSPTTPILAADGVTPTVGITKVIEEQILTLPEGSSSATQKGANVGGTSAGAM